MDYNYTPPLSRKSFPKNVTKLYDTPLDTSWREDAFCKGKDISMFFPSSTEPRNLKFVVQALQYCYHCPVAHHCLYEAMKYNYDGVWGNTIYKQRIHMVRTELNNDLDNLTLEKAEEFVQTSKIESYSLLNRTNIRLRRNRLKPKEVDQ